MQAIEDPRASQLRLAFKGFDGITILQSQANVIETVEQAVTAEVIDLEAEGLAAGRNDLTLFQIDCDLVAFRREAFAEELIDLRFLKNHRQHAVLEAVVEENVGLARRDHGTETVLIQRPRRMLA